MRGPPSDLRAAARRGALLPRRRSGTPMRSRASRTSGHASMDAESYTTTLGTTSAQLLTKVQPRDADDQPDGSAGAHEAALADRALLHARRRAQAGGADPGASSTQAFDAAAGRRAGRPVQRLRRRWSRSMSPAWPTASRSRTPSMLNRLVWRFFAREEGVEGMTPDGLAAMMEMIGYFAELIQQAARGRRSPTARDRRAARRRDRRAQASATRSADRTSRCS